MQRVTIFLAYYLIPIAIGSVNCFAQQQPFNPSYNFRHINAQNGLVQNIVYHFLEDSRGYMWFGTHNGVTLHDGTRGLNFLHNPQVKTSIAGTFINGILEDSSQQIWIGTEKGIDRFNRSSLTFTHFGVDREDGTKDNTYCEILGFIKSNELWFLDTKTKSLRCLNTASGKTTYIATFNTSHGLFYKNAVTQTVHLWSAYDKGTTHQVYKENKLIKEETFFDGKNKSNGLPELVVFHVLQQNDSTVWISTDKGLVKMDLLLNKYRIFNSWRGGAVRELRYTAVAGKHLLWAASGPDGIYSFDISKNQFTANFRNNEFDPSSICSNNIVSLYLDKTGNLWCGSFGSGLSHTNTKSSFFARHVSKEETAGWKGNNHVSLLGTDLEGNFWCTFQNIIGIGRIDKDLKIRQYRTPVMPNGAVYDQPIYKLIFESTDEAWMATNKGLFLHNFKTNRLIPIPYQLVSGEVQGSIWIKDMIRLLDGSILFCTYAGLYHMTNTSGKPTIKPLMKPGAYKAFSKLVQDERGLVYARSMSDSIYVLRSSSTGDEFEVIRTIDFLPDVNHFFNSGTDATLYIASEDGLYTINTNTFAIKKETLDDRIPFMNVSSVFRKDEKLWLFGEKGLYCFDKKTNESRTFTTEDGLPADDFTESSFVFDNAGRCIAGTSNGLMSFSPSDIEFIGAIPRVRLTAFYINDTRDTLHANPDEIRSIKLSAKQNTFSFDFSPVSFFHTADCSFEYKLDGYDDNWIKSGGTRYTRYSKTPPGKYTFMLRVLDNQGKISPYSKVLEIEIAKSFWQTTFFQAGVLVLMLLAGWLFLKWYSNEKMKKQKAELEKLKAIEKERTRIASDMHDDLGAGLSRIKFLSETIGIKKQKQQSFDEDIAKIREYSHEMIDKMGEIVWALNEKNDTLSDLLSYTRAYAVEYLSQNGITCVVNAPEQFPSTFVSGEFRRDIYLTVKEALHNIVKHAQASGVTIKIGVNSTLQIEIQDNGTGFDRSKIRSFSNGLASMESRIKDIKGDFAIINGLGTTIRIKVPLPA